jgi:hypothetical protein
LEYRKRIKPISFLLIISAFALFCIALSNSFKINQYNFVVLANQELSPQRYQSPTSVGGASSNICGTPITIYEDTLSCPQSSVTEIDFGQRNGGGKSGQIVVSKNLQAKVYSISKPTTLLSGSDIPNTAPVLRKDSLMLPSADTFFSEKHFNYGKYPGQDTPTHQAAPYASDYELKFGEADAISQKGNYIEDEYRVSNTQACASCKSDPTSSNMYAQTLRKRTEYPNQGYTNTPTASLACATPNSISVNSLRLACIDEKVSLLTRLTSFFTDTSWIECNKVEYDEEGRLISDGRCIDTKDITLELDGIFEETNTTYKKMVHTTKSPKESVEYNGEIKYVFPAKIQVDGRIYSINASINAPAEYYRNASAVSNIPGDTVSAQLYNAFIKFWSGQDSTGIFNKL